MAQALAKAKADKKGRDKATSEPNACKSDDNGS